MNVSGGTQFLDPNVYGNFLDFFTRFAEQNSKIEVFSGTLQRASDAMDVQRQNVSSNPVNRLGVRC